MCGSKIRILSGILLFFAGCACFLYPDFREWQTQRNVEHIIEDFQKAHTISEEKRETENETGESAEQETENTLFPELYAEMQDYNKRLVTEGQRIVDAWSYEQSGIDLSSFCNGDPLGYIEIPDMEVRLPLFIGASNENLAHGAAVLSETSMPIGGENTNCVIAAHRGWKGSAYFQHIENMKKGSLVYIINPWETLVYCASDIKIIEPNDVGSILIQEGRDMITLFSCHPYMSGGIYRYLVYCERIGTDAGSGTDRPGLQEIKEQKKDRIGIQEDDKTENPDDEIGTAAYSGLAKWEKIIRTALPLQTLLFAFIIIFFRYFK